MRVTKQATTILAVVKRALDDKVTLPEAVELYRSDLRHGMRRSRKMQRTARTAGVRVLAERHVARLRRESARVRRLQLRFASWRA